MCKSTEITHFPTIHVKRYQPLVLVLNKKNQIVIWMDGDHIVARALSAIHSPKQLQTAYCVLQDPLWCIIVLKNPDAQFITPPFCTDKIRVIIINFETLLMVDVMQFPLGLANIISHWQAPLLAC